MDRTSFVHGEPGGVHLNRGADMDIRKHPDVLRFRRAAECFCRLLESPPGDADRWVEDVLAALARLYACGHALPTFGVSDDGPDLREMFQVDDEEWRRVYDLVHDTLGPQYTYWAYFDPSEPRDSKEKPIFHDLGDDLADIYRDIKPGLRAWDAGLETYLRDIVFGWKFPLFSSHWGVHAVSAMRALHPIAFLRGAAVSHELP
jgi:hypothetical protein